MKKILFMFLIMFALPVYVFASSEIVVNKTSLSIDNGSSESFTISANNASGTFSLVASNAKINISSNITDPEKFYIDSENERTWNLVLNNSSATITVSALDEGDSNVSINAIDVIDLDDNSNVNYTGNVYVTINHVASSNANLSDIKIDGESIIGFSPNTTTYNISTEKSSVSISALVEDERASVEPNYGLQNLSYGKNTFDLTVTAENRNTQKTYQLNITRIDTRDVNNNLKSLGISDGEIDFNKSVLNYSVKIESEITSVIIDAETESDKATVTGVGEYQLKDSNNVFEIIVTAENGSTKKYTITVIRNNQYLIVFNSNGGTKCNPDRVAVTKGTKIGALCKTTRSGYNFVGWYTESSGGDKVTSNTIANSNFTIYAQWSKKVKTNNPETGIETPIITILVIGFGSLGVYLLIKNRKLNLN